MNPTSSQPQPVVLMLLLRSAPSGTEVLLGRKLRGFGAGNIVAPGGKIEPGEQADAAAIRELFEETSMSASEADSDHRATVRFRFPSRPLSDMDCQVFTATVFDGHPVASDELDPRWYPISQLPGKHMWQDAADWLPRIIDGQRFTATVVMAQDNVAVETISYRYW